LFFCLSSSPCPPFSFTPNVFGAVGGFGFFLVFFFFFWGHKSRLPRWIQFGFSHFAFAILVPFRTGSLSLSLPLCPRIHNLELYIFSERLLFVCLFIYLFCWNGCRTRLMCWFHRKISMETWSLWKVSLSSLVLLWFKLLLLYILVGSSRGILFYLFVGTFVKPWHNSWWCAYFVEGITIQKC